MASANNVTLYLDETGEMITISLTQEEMERASRDEPYLQKLVGNKIPSLMCGSNVKANASAEAEVHEDDENSSMFSSNVEANASTEAEVHEEDENSSMFIWTVPCVQLLLSLYEEEQDNFHSGAKRHKKIWEEVATKMRNNNKSYVMTGSQCQSKLNGLKKTFKKILDHNNKSGNDRITWPYFDRMNEIFGATGWAKPKATASDHGPSPSSPAPEPSSSAPTPKRKRVEADIAKYMSQIKERRQAENAEKENRRNLCLQKKEERFQRFTEMMERQHLEKMNALKELCKAFKK